MTGRGSTIGPVPNGFDKNLIRLRMACAAYNARFGAWPSEARLEPIILQNLAQILDEKNFQRLADKLELRTTTREDQHVVVVGADGQFVYGREEPSHGPTDYERARRWLGVRLENEDDD